MASNSTTLSPNASPSAVPPLSSGVSSPPSPSTSSNTLAPSSPSVPSATPPSVPSATPPSVPSATPPSPSITPPPSPSLSPPPSPPTATTPPPTTSPPPSPPVSTPPPAPATTTAPPPAETTPSLPNLSPPPPTVDSPPPQSLEPPPSKPILPSPPPPANVPRPPSSNPPPAPQAKPPSTNPPPAPQAKPPKSTPSPPLHHASPPSVSQSPPSPPAEEVTTPPPSTLPSTPSTDVPPPASLPSTPPLVPSGSTPPASLPRSPTNQTNAGGPAVSLPSIPTEKPTARPTNDGAGNVATNNSPSHSGGLNTGGAVVIGLVVGFIFLSLLVMAVWIVQKKKKKEKGAGAGAGYAVASPFTSSQNSGTLFLRPQSPANFIGSGSGSDLRYSQSEGGVSSSRSWFTYEELIQATNRFSEQNLLGEGGFGCVYKGLLIDGREVAVKQLKIGGGQGEREFSAEVETISRVHHRHLVSLVGYCISEHQRLLVYDYVPNNTLHHHLHEENGPILDWPTRVKVAAGAARGIAYLHEDCHPRIIHRDIKSSNILLDQNFEALVSDFGLAKLTLDSNTHVTTRVMGTFGYMAPEYATSGKLTDKSDVYSFGVVLLELITGRKPVDSSQPIGDESLVEWARPLLIEALDSEDFETLVDPKLGKNYNRNEMFRMIEAAAACVRHSSVKRPRMNQVMRALDSMDEFSDLNNGMKPGQSSMFNSAEQSAQIRMFRRMAFGSQDSSNFFNESQSSWRSRDHDSTAMFPQNKSGSWNV